MNRINIIGRLTSKPELRYSQSNTAITRGAVAVNRKFKNQQGEYEADFINIVAFNKTAELLNQYFDKGSQIGISGRIQTGSYEDKNGKKVYTTDVVVEDITFIDKKESGQALTVEEVEQYTKKEEVDPFSSFGEQIALDDGDLD